MQTATVTFKAKIETIYNMDDTVAFTRIKMPVRLTKSHCDMNAFRSHPTFSGFANSDMFPALLARELKKTGIGAYLRLDQPLPDAVAIDTSGFLAQVTITL